MCFAPSGSLVYLPGMQTVASSLLYHHAPTRPPCALQLLPPDELDNPLAILVVKGKTKTVVLDLSSEQLDPVLEVLGHVASGSAVRVVPVGSEVSIQEAADILHATEQYLLRALEDGLLPSRTIGSQRMVPVRSLLDHKRRRDAERRAALAELASESQRVGLWEWSLMTA